MCVIFWLIFFSHISSTKTIQKWSAILAFIIPDLYWMPLIAVFVITWSIATVVFLVTRVALFVVGIKLYWNMLLECWTFNILYTFNLNIQVTRKNNVFRCFIICGKKFFVKLFKYCHITVWRPMYYTFYPFCGVFQYRVTLHHLNLWIDLYVT